MSRSILSIRRFLQLFIAWWIISIILQAIVLYYFGLAINISLADSIVSNLFIAGACLLVVFTMQFYLPQKEPGWYIFALSILLSIMAVCIAKYILTKIYAGDSFYIRLLEKALPLRLFIAFLLTVCMSVISLLWYSFQDQKEIEARNIATEKLNKEAELFKLRSQLQPHFLFNSLNSISALAGTRPEEARKMIQQLSDFLRGTIKKEEEQSVSFEDELKHLQLYLEIEKVRFGHRLSTDIQCDPSTQQLKIPALLLQPIVENAIKFGLYDTIDTVVIEISAITENNLLIITVKNPYDPQTVTIQKGAGFGLNAVKRRLYLLFARTDLLETIAAPTLFTTILKIPQAS